MRMNSTKIGITGAIVFVVLLTQTVSGQYEAIGSKMASVLCEFYSVFWNIIGVLGVVVILAAGVQWIVSRDQPAKRKQAQDIIIATIIGLVLAGITLTLINAVAATANLDPVHSACK